MFHFVLNLLLLQNIIYKYTFSKLNDILKDKYILMPIQICTNLVIV